VAAELEGLGAGGAPGLGGLARGVDLHVDVERGRGGRGEEAPADVELCGFLDGVDGADDPEVGDGGGQGLAFVWRLLATSSSVSVMCT